MVWTCEEDGWLKIDSQWRSLEWVPNGRKRGGRPKKIWIEGIMNLMKERGLQDGDWEDRDEWRKRIKA